MTTVVELARPGRKHCQSTPIPPARDLTWEQYAGRTCVVCGRRLTSDAVSRGWARGRQGVHVLDVEVWACP
ncbi:hypothetical protein AB0M39_08875 [Streptomyces sp. NPDC051907]|uniref:hypothetical protein n=1 Tax=Streptomyces sp. NPDC051907 TaxID=3155284 RepID=UPI0034228ADC